MDDASAVKKIKIIIREGDCPFFEDDEIMFYLQENDRDFNKTVRALLIIKAENTTLSISGMQAADTSKYFLRLASKYRINNSGTLRGG